MKKFLSLLITFVLLSLLSITAFANEQTPAYSMRGAYHSDNIKYFHYDITPGSTIKDGIFLQNHDEDRTILLHLNFITPAQRVDGTIPIKIPDEWLKFDSTEITLGPKNNKTINFEIEIPKDLESDLYEVTLETAIVNYSEAGEDLEPFESEGIGINIGVGKSLVLNMKEGDPVVLDRTSVAGSGQTDIQKKDSDKISHKIYDFIKDRFEIILIFIIVLLLIKVTVLSKKKEDKAKK